MSFQMQPMLNNKPESTVSREHRINYEIKALRVLLIDKDDVKQGVMDIKDAIRRAKDDSLDLVEVAKNDVTVCKIMDYNKFLYSQKKKIKHNESQREETHEMRLSPSIAPHDMEIKARKVLEFFEKNSKVKLQIKLAGREKRIPGLVEATAYKFYEFVKDNCKIEHIAGAYVLIPHKKN